MHLFLSAGEPSGDLHGANLIRAIRARHPDVKIVGFGGEKMEAAGAQILYPLTKIAVMWFGRALLHMAKFVRLAKQAKTYFHEQRPDAVIVIDYPGFNFALAKRAAEAGIPVYYFLPPQLWAWAGWRIKKVKKYFTGVLTTKPFEDKWYRERGVDTQYVGHPYFDELVAQTTDAAFLDWLTAFSDMASAEQKSLLNRYRLLSVLLGKLAAMKEEVAENLTGRSPLERHADVEPDLREKWEHELAAAIEAEYRRQRADLLAGLQWWFRDIWLYAIRQLQCLHLEPSQQ